MISNYEQDFDVDFGNHELVRTKHGKHQQPAQDEDEDDEDLDKFLL